MKTEHYLSVGIEHLMTGVQIQPADGETLRFERESASIVRVSSDKPFSAYWPVKQITIDSVEGEPTRAKYGEGYVEWCAQKLAPAMVEKDGVPKWVSDKLGDIPTVVIRAMRNRFGVESMYYITRMHNYGDYFGFEYAGMFLGVEKKDGYIHS